MRGNSFALNLMGTADARTVPLSLGLELCNDKDSKERRRRLGDGIGEFPISPVCGGRHRFWGDGEVISLGVRARSLDELGVVEPDPLERGGGTSEGDMGEKTRGDLVSWLSREGSSTRVSRSDCER